MIGSPRAVHHCSAVLAVCDDNIKGRKPPCLESTLLEHGVHQGHTQALAHAHQGIPGVITEFVKQLQALTNGPHVGQTFFDFSNHGVCRSPIEQVGGRREVSRTKVRHTRMPCGIPVSRRTPCREQSVGGSAHGGKHNEFGHVFPRLQHVGHLRHGRRIDQRTSSKFDDFHGV